MKGSLKFRLSWFCKFIFAVTLSLIATYTELYFLFLKNTIWVDNLMFYFYYFINLFTIFFLFLELVYGTCNQVVPVEFIVTIILYGLWGGGSWHETATKVLTGNTAFSTLYYMNFLTKSGQFLICLMVKSHYHVLVILVQNWTWCNAGTIVFLSLVHTAFQETLPEFAFQNY